ncbi:MAG: alkaline phosphatase family protein [Candidatus Nezhaarchaeales archaeon]
MRAKLVLAVLDGAADRPSRGPTPLERARKPALDYISSRGACGLMYPVRRGVAPESDVAVMSILGYDPFVHYTGRGPIEAVGAGVEFRDGDVALRCNFATLEGWEVVDRRVGRSLTTEEAAELARAVEERVRLTSHPCDLEFRATVGHRAVLVLRGRGVGLSANISNTDPAYARLGGLGVAEARPSRELRWSEPLDGSEEARRTAELVNEFTRRAREVLEGHPINVKRAAEGRARANGVLCRDAGDRLPKLEPVEARFGLSFACLADMPVEKGVAKLVGMEVEEVPPGRSLEDYRLRASRAAEALERHDAVYVHLKGPDEAGHDGDLELKVEALELIDEGFFSPLLDYVDLSSTLICVTSDHATPCDLRAHSDDPVPIAVCGPGVEPDGVACFSEGACAGGRLGIIERGVELMPLLAKLAGAREPK